MRAIDVHAHLSTEDNTYERRFDKEVRTMMQKYLCSGLTILRFIPSAGLRNSRREYINPRWWRRFCIRMPKGCSVSVSECHFMLG